MYGLLGILLMAALSYVYFNEIGWKFLVGAWLIVLLAPSLTLLGMSGWLVLLIQGAVLAGLYLKAKGES